MKKYRKTALFAALLMSATVLTSCNGTSGDITASSTTATTSPTTVQTSTQPTTQPTTKPTTTQATTTIATTTTTAKPTTTKPTTTKVQTTTYYQPPTTNVIEGKKLVWSDEFIGTEINSANWTHEIGRVRNGEPQYYTDRDENSFVKDGNLHLRAMKENYMGANYTSASVKSSRKQEFKYGVFEMRCKMPDGPGCWPAFWTLGARNSWPVGGEIDIFEWYSTAPDNFGSTMHWASNYVGHINMGVCGYLYRGPKEKNLINEFHTYGMIWDEKEIKFYCDNYILGSQEITREDMKTPFHQPHYILANLALKGPSLETFKTTDFIIDYIRVYQ